ncbi:OTU domain-containing protein 6B [Hondaea fermentalgiana]|uniref:OTU domain-containing protein 6B n=1 Tax=Hondaea fermentalgiana TaxID=2315210 RepID=A0A2R5H1E0_9STRA|nr:OTU domain-containing protein 6B [Hondaea fermentalgiana]|eukprot:GBG34154.1 OTU domain-containing protein 6B [Hondaea fermentalgiana]
MAEETAAAETAMSAEASMAAELVAAGTAEGKSAALIKEGLQSKHKAERKALRKDGNDALSGLKGDERKRVEVENNKKKEEQAEKHGAEMAALEAALEAAASAEGENGDGEQLAAGTSMAVPKQNQVTRAQKRREKKKEQEKLAKERFAERKAQAGPSRRDREMETISAKLLGKGFALKEVEADGHCLYRAVADQLIQKKQTSVGESKEPHKLLRTMCAQYMRTHRPLFEPFIALDDEGGEQGAHSFEEYLDTVQNSAEWGGQLELRALAGALQTPIEVYAADGPMVIMGEDFTGEPLRVSFHQHFLTLGEHYNSVQPSSAIAEADNF